MMVRESSRGVGLLARASVVAAVALALAPEAFSQCLSPSGFGVCQDVYGTSRGRAFLFWTNEADYSSVRVYQDGGLLGEVSGNLRAVYISNVSNGTHTFAIEGVCGGVASARVGRDFTLIAATPHTAPVEATSCSFDPTRGRITATWVLGEPSLFIDVYVRRVGVAGLLYVTTLRGDAVGVLIDGTVESDRVVLQFFDEDCYGSELVGCEAASGCPAPVELRICQDIYDEQRSRVFLLWTPVPGVSGHDILVGGVKVGEAGPTSGLFYVEVIAPGEHEFTVQARCGSEFGEPLTATFEVVPETPHGEPFRNLRCERDLARRSITATWLPATAPSRFIDIYVRTPGQAVLDFVATIAGSNTRVRVSDTGPDDQIVLQFFDLQCYGSPLFGCGDNPGSGDFLRGDANGSGTVDLSDTIFTLRFLFTGATEVLCLDAADADDDGGLNLSDGIFIARWLFSGGPTPPAPGPELCGMDPTADSLTRCLTAGCR